MTDLADLFAHLERLEAWAAREVPALAEALRPGAAPEQLHALETVLGCSLPPELYTLYCWHDGQEPGAAAPGLFFGLPLLPLSEVERFWRAEQRALATDLSLAEDADENTSRPPDAVRRAYVSPGWIPLADDAGGNFLGLDLTPGPAGVAGQVINFGRDERERVVLADGLGDFVRWVLAQYEGGNFVLEDEADGEYSLNIREPQSTHFLDAARELF